MYSRIDNQPPYKIIPPDSPAADSGGILEHQAAAIDAFSSFKFESLKGATCNNFKLY